MARATASTASTASTHGKESRRTDGSHAAGCSADANLVKKQHFAIPSMTLCRICRTCFDGLDPSKQQLFGGYAPEMQQLCKKL